MSLNPFRQNCKAPRDDSQRFRTTYHAPPRYTVSDTRTMKVPRQSVPQLLPRDDINFTEQCRFSKIHQQQRLLDAHMVDYESTLASTETHINFTEMLLGEAYRYRLSRCYGACTHAPCGGGILPPRHPPGYRSPPRNQQSAVLDPRNAESAMRLKRKVNRIWASCLHQVTLCAQDGTDPYPEVLQSLSRLHLWDVQQPASPSQS